MCCSGVQSLDIPKSGLLLRRHAEAQLRSIDERLCAERTA
jgi:hypothetical protein